MKAMHLVFAALFAVFAISPVLHAYEPDIPVPGAVRRIYAVHPHNTGSDHERWHQETVEAILAGRIAPYSTSIDSSSGGFRILNGSEIGMWTGWIQCRNGGTYTLVVNRTSSMGAGWYLFSLWVNGRPLASGRRGATTSFNVPLQAGFNEIRLISEGSSGIDNHVELSLKRSDSVKPPSVLSPGALWHEDEPEEEEDGEEDWVPATPAASAPAPRPAPRRSSFNIGDYLPDYDP